MITKRTGNGQTECVRCKEKGKFALTWDSFLFTYNDKPYCSSCLFEMLEEKDNAIDEAIKYIKEHIQYYDDGEYSGYECEIDGLKLWEILERGKNGK